MRACAANSDGGGNVRPSANNDAIVSDFSAITDPRDPTGWASGVTLRAFSPSLASARSVPACGRASAGEDEDAVSTEAGGIGERGPLADPAAVADGLEVTDVGAG